MSSEKQLLTDIAAIMTILQNTLLPNCMKIHVFFAKMPFSLRNKRQIRPRRLEEDAGLVRLVAGIHGAARPRRGVPELRELRLRLRLLPPSHGRLHVPATIFQKM